MKRSERTWEGDDHELSFHRRMLCPRDPYRLDLRRAIERTEQYLHVHPHDGHNRRLLAMARARLAELEREVTA